MAVYKNINTDSPIASVEFMPVAEGNYSIIRARTDGDREKIKEWLKTAEPGQQVIGDTNVNGAPLLVTTGTKSRDEWMGAIVASGASLELDKPKVKFNPWMWRGASSIVGQSLQLLSGFKSFKKGGSIVTKNSADNAAIIGFATTNLVANGVNMAFGAQTTDDPHHLLVLKKHFNEKLKPLLSDGQQPIDPLERRAELITEPVQKSLGQKSHDLAQRYSVSGGEVGLRVLGTLSLSYPATKWKETLKTIGSGSSLSKINNVARNPDPFTYKVGLYTLLGKAVAFASKAPDPYNPKPATFIDKIRENVTFRASSVIEGIAAGVMAYDRYKNKSIMFRGKERRDWFGVAGNAVFIGGYVIRLFAPFGSREVDMKELRAHITGTLARIPQNKLPQVLADTAADLAQHFKGKYKYSELYTDLETDLYRYHGIAVSTRAVQGIEEKLAQEGALIPQVAAAEEATGAFAKAHPQKPRDLASVAKTESYRDRVRKAEEVGMMVSP